MIAILGAPKPNANIAPIEGTTMQKFLSTLLLCTCLIAPLNTRAESVKQCASEARSAFKTCHQQCVDDRKDALLVCRFFTPETDCSEQCKAAYLACNDPIKAQQEACIDDCYADLEASRVACGTECNCTPDVNCGANACFGTCMDEPFVVRASCRANCYRDVERRNARRDCNRAARSCKKLCND